KRRSPGRAENWPVARGLRIRSGYAIGFAPVGRAPQRRWWRPASTLREERSMTIKVGDKVPAATFRYLTSEGPKEITTDELFAGKKVAFFAVPGAFTPTCSQRHLPSYIDKAAALKAKGVDTIACVAVNDAFVMGAWGKAQDNGDRVM